MSTSSFSNPDAARIATAIGLFSSGVLSGGILSLSAIATPALLASAHSPDKTVLPRIFARLYTRGRATAPPIAALSFLSFAYASYAHYAAREARWPAYLAAGALSLAIVPYTLAAMGRTVGTLMHAAGADAGEEEEEEEGALDVEGQVRALVRWTRLNWVRGSLPLAGFAVGLWAAFQ